MSKRTDFVNNTTVVEDDWVDDEQEMMSRWVGGIRLERTGSATIRATIDAHGAIITDSGKRRFVTVSPTLVVSGGAGSRNVYAIGGSDSGGDPSINTNKAWVLEAAVGAAAGANPRKLGTLEWDGSAVKNIRYTAGQQPPADLFNSFIITPNDPYGIPLTLKALAGQASTALFQIGTDASDVDRLVVTTAGMLLLPVSGATGGVRFAGEAASNLYRSAASTIKTDGSLVVAVDLAVAGAATVGTTLGVTGAVTGASFAGPVLLPDGVVGTPAIRFADDLDTGIYSPANGQVAVAVDGSQRGLFSTAGLTVTGGGIIAQGSSRIGSADAQTLGFFSVSGVARRTGYAVTNVTTDRGYDANSTTVNEIADVLGTLIADLTAYGLIG